MKNKLLMLFILTAGFSTTANAVIFDRGSQAELWFLILIMGVALLIIWKPILMRNVKNLTSERRCTPGDRRLSVSERRCSMSDRRQAA